MNCQRRINHFVMFSTIISIILGIISGLIFPIHFLNYYFTLYIELILGVITMLKVFPGSYMQLTARGNSRGDITQFIRYVFFSALGAVMSTILSLSIAFVRTSPLDRVIFGVDIAFFFMLFFSVAILFVYITSGRRYNE